MSQRLRFITDKRRHLICLPYSISNLHRMAEELQIGRWWFHKDHYDLPIRRQFEIESHCLIVSPRTILRVVRNHRRKFMSDMTKNQSENHDHEAVLLQKYLNQGKPKAHLCPDWDFMAIHADTPEFECCTCEWEDK